jgi:sugar phosphate isomerase/epimerase
MLRWPIGFSTGCFYRHRITDCLEPIRRREFTLLEISSSLTHFNYKQPAEVEAVRRAIQDLGMCVHSVHAPYAHDLDISHPDSGVRAAAGRELTSAAEAAGKLEARNLVVHPGPERSFHPPAEERRQRLEHAVEILDQLALRCRELGVRLMLENMLPLLIFGNTGDMLTMLGSLMHGPAGVCLDTGHAFLSGNLLNVLHKLSAFIQMLHIHDNWGRLDDHLPPGQGHIPWPQVMQELAKIPFDGVLIQELIHRPDQSMETILDQAALSRDYLLQLEVEES